MKVLVAGEKSQVICKAFREQNHEAYSCDLLPTDGNPEWHILGDLRGQLEIYYDLVIFHPVCRFLTNAGVRWLHTEPGRWDKMREACYFFNLRHKFNSPRVATENPRPHKYAVELIGKSTFNYQPWHHGEKEMKDVEIGKRYIDGFCTSQIITPVKDEKYQRGIRWEVVKCCVSREIAEIRN